MGRPARIALAGLTAAAIVVLAAIVLLVYVFTPSADAPEVEWELAQELPDVTALTCERLYFEHWDYACSYSHVPDGQRITVRVRVDEQGIVERDRR